MLHQCGHHSGGGMTHPCSCGLYYGACNGGGSAFSFLFPMAGNKPMEELSESHYSIPSSSSVDCTLSLGTPSTRQTDATTPKPTSSNPIPRVSSLCWDIISQSNKMGSKGATSGSNGSSSSNLGGDPVLLARRCANCDTTSTPLWRNGPRGPKSLCNACGIRYKKEERRMLASSTAAASPSTSVLTSAERAGGYGYQNQQPWSGYGSTASKGSYGEESAEDGELPYLSWRLNVVPSAQIPVRDLFQYN